MTFATLIVSTKATSILCLPKGSKPPIYFLTFTLSPQTICSLHSSQSDLFQIWLRWWHSFAENPLVFHAQANQIGGFFKYCSYVQSPPGQSARAHSCSRQVWAQTQYFLSKLTRNCLCGPAFLRCKDKPVDCEQYSWKQIFWKYPTPEWLLRWLTGEESACTLGWEDPME